MAERDTLSYLVRGYLVISKPCRSQELHELCRRLETIENFLALREYDDLDNDGDEIVDKLNDVFIDLCYYPTFQIQDSYNQTEPSYSKYSHEELMKRVESIYNWFQSLPSSKEHETIELEILHSMQRLLQAIESAMNKARQE
jgi:hypothetical protein